MSAIKFNKENQKHTVLISKYAKIISSVNNATKEEMGRDLLPNEMFGMFVREVGVDKANSNFNFFREAFIQSNIKIAEPFDWNALYDRYFSKVKNFNHSDKTIKTQVWFKRFNLDYISRLNKIEVLIVSAILGNFIGLLLGYIFGETTYLVSKGFVVSEEYYLKLNRKTYLNKYFDFNYILAISGFIITFGVSYLYLKLKITDE